MQKRLAVAAVLVLGAASAPVATAASATGVAPTVSTLSTTRGGSVGGTQLVVTGRHFTAKAVVLFGTSRGYQLTVLSSTRLRVRAPRHTAGTVNVRVRTGGGTSKTVRDDRFTFVDAPVISRMSSHASTPSGGTTLTISGAKFVDVRKVSFAATPATHVRVLSTRSLSVTVPAHGSGVVQVRVFGVGGPSALTAADLFTYAPATPVTDVLAPPGQPGARLYDTACNSHDVCFAVGDVESGQTDQPLVETLNRPGGAWMSTALSLPPGAGGPPIGALRAVSCSADSGCYAAGSYLTNDGYERPLLEHFDGSVWHPIEVALPDRATDGYLTDIACPTATMCAMSGRAATSAHSSAAFLATYHENDGTTAVLAPAPDGYTASNLDLGSVACASSTLCVSLATVQNPASGGITATSDVLSGSTWASNPVPAPDGDPSSWFLSSVACRSVTTCVAVGDSISPVPQPGSTAPLISTFTHGAWTSMTAPTPQGYEPNDGGPNLLNSVSCARSYCEAAGAIQVGDKPTAGLIERSTADGSWSPSTRYDATGQRTNLTEISCAGAAFCTATGGTAPADGSAQDNAPAIAVIEHSGAAQTDPIPLPKNTSGSVTAYNLSCALQGDVCVGIGILSNGDRTLLTFS